jgi:hypothetical protein
MFLALTPHNEGMSTNDTIFLCVYFICMAAVAIAFFKYKR